MKSKVLSAFVAFVGGYSVLAQNTGETTVTIHPTDAWASEVRLGTGTFTARRAGPTNFPLLVFYTLTGTASNGVDYERLGNTVQIPAGAFDASFTLQPIDDSLVEGTESVLVQITGSPLACATCGYRIGEPSLAEVFIADNDPQDGTNDPPVLRLNEPENGAVFRAPADITLRACAQDAEDHFDLQVEFLAGTNRLGLGTFVGTRCAAPFCPYFQLIWSNAPPGEYVLSARVTDSHGATTVSEPAHVRVMGAVNLYATDPEAFEIRSVPNIDPPSNPAVFTVRRFGETNTGIVVFYEVSGTASNGVDYQRLPGYVALPEGASSAEIVVQPIDDHVVEGTETIVLTLLPTCPQCLFVNPPCLPPQGTNCYPLGPDQTAVAYLRDDETENLDFALRIFVRVDGSVALVLPEGLLVTGGFEAEVSQDLRTWTRLGPFQPGNVAAFYLDDPPQDARGHRFYRSVYVPPDWP